MHSMPFNRTRWPAGPNVSARGLQPKETSMKKFIIALALATAFAAPAMAANFTNAYCQSCQ
jgi:hypothetical protein